MNATRLQISLCASLLGIVLLAGCGDDESTPMAPDPTPETAQFVELTTTITRFECIKDGDGIEGAGEFRFKASVPWDSKEWDRTLSSGNSSTLNWATDASYSYAGKALSTFVKFTCTEWDKDITGRDYADGDMNARYAEAIEVVPGADITNYITLGNDNCKVRLHYTITSKVVEHEI